MDERKQNTYMMSAIAKYLCKDDWNTSAIHACMATHIWQLHACIQSWWWDSHLRRVLTLHACMLGCMYCVHEKFVIFILQFYESAKVLTNYWIENCLCRTWCCKYKSFHTFHLQIMQIWNFSPSILFTYTVCLVYISILIVYIRCSAIHGCWYLTAACIQSWGCHLRYLCVYPSCILASYIMYIWWA